MPPRSNSPVALVKSNPLQDFGLHQPDRNEKKLAQGGVIEELDHIFDELAEQDPLWLESFKSKKKI